VIAAYVSGHGYGHATRVGEVLRAVRERDADVPLAVVSSAPEALFRRAVPGPLAYRRLECDVGLVQADALVIDEAATVERWRAFTAGARDRVAAEAQWLAEVGARLVVADIPPLAFDAAAEAGLPGVGLANFSWDWIYRHLSRRQPGLAAAADAAAASYGRAHLLLELPFAGDLGAFPRREKIPLVARRPKRARNEVRKVLDHAVGPLVLLSFGGLGLPGFDARVLEPLAGSRFVQVGEAWGAANVRSLRPEQLDLLGLGYEDLVAAADVVVTKPGYGIVSDAIAARTRIVYTERGDFPEYPILVEGMSRHLPCVHVSNEDLRAGKLEEPLRRVLEIPFPEPAETSGAAVAAERLLAIAGATARSAPARPSRTS
jgi:L-arabinokinase